MRQPSPRKRYGDVQPYRRQRTSSDNYLNIRNAPNIDVRDDNPLCVRMWLDACYSPDDWPLWLRRQIFVTHWSDARVRTHRQLQRRSLVAIRQRSATSRSSFLVQCFM